MHESNEWREGGPSGFSPCCAFSTGCVDTNVGTQVPPRPPVSTLYGTDIKMFVKKVILFCGFQFCNRQFSIIESSLSLAALSHCHSSYAVCNVNGDRFTTVNS